MQRLRFDYHFFQFKRGVTIQVIFLKRRNRKGRMLILSFIDSVSPKETAGTIFPLTGRFCSSGVLFVFSIRALHIPLEWSNKSRHKRLWLEAHLKPSLWGLYTHSWYEGRFRVSVQHVGEVHISHVRVLLELLQTAQSLLRLQAQQL